MNIKTQYIAGTILLILGVMLAHGSAAAQAVSTSAELTVTNSGSPQSSRTLLFGVNPSATPGIDPELEEQAFPPFPPTASFEARFVTHGGSDLGEGSPADFRPFTATTQKDEYKIKFQPGTNGLPITITWDKEYLKSRYTSVKMSDPFGGVILTADMLATNSVQISNAALTEVVIEAEGPKDPSSGVEDAGERAADDLNLESSWSAAEDRVTVDYSVERPAAVSLAITDLNGTRVAAIVDEPSAEAGDYSQSVDAAALPAGVYFVSLNVGGAAATRRIVIAR